MALPAAAFAVLAALCISPFVAGNRVQAHGGRDSGGKHTKSADGKTLESSDRTDAGSTQIGFGPFAGIEVERDFPRASFWGRDGEAITITHFDKTEGELEEDLVFAAEYNTAAGVSDIVYYSVDKQNFCVGCGRGGGWNNDESLKLNELFEGRKSAAQYFATVQDYQGVGHFDIDRGHQAPVGSFNSQETEPDLTNMPTNLSPQSSLLNQKKWRFLEADLRSKAKYNEHGRGRELDVLTGPLYELPAAMVQANTPKQKWREVLANKKTGWCGQRKGGGAKAPCGKDDGSECHVYGTKPVKASVSANIQCHVQYAEGADQDADPRDDPNNLEMHFNAGKSRSFPLRIPLGYFKLFVVKKGGPAGRRACAFIMDQVGSCLLVSVKLLAKIAHIDLAGTEYGKVTQLDHDPPSNKSLPYSSYVNHNFCLPKGGWLEKTNACYKYKTVELDDPEDITTEMIEEHWSEQIDE